MTVENTGDRPIQVGSHYELASANPALAFDRARRGRPPPRHPGRDVGALRAGRVAMDVTLVPLAGARIVRGLQRAVDPGSGERG